MEPKFGEETYRRIVEAAPSAFVVVDRAGAIVLVNAHAERLSGWTRGEMIGRPVEMLVPEGLRARHPAHRAAFLAEPSTRPMGGRELRLARKDGSELPVEIGLSLHETEAGPCVLASIVDITERRRLDAALRESAADLARSNTDLEQFAYVASHDLQEPLRMVSSFVEMLAQKYGGKLDDDAHRYIGYAADGAKRMHAMIHDLLAYSRAGRHDTALAPVDCAQALADALANLERVIAHSGAQVAVLSPLPRVRGNPTQLAQVFQNLVENAIKYRSEAPPRIEVSAAREGAAWRVSVRDNGIGIAPRFAERIFRVFQRLHDRSKYPGTGIGLAVVKRIVERHGGRVWVESAPGAGAGSGAGATFHFTLPAEGPT